MPTSQLTSATQPSQSQGPLGDPFLRKGLSWLVVLAIGFCGYWLASSWLRSSREAAVSETWRGYSEYESSQLGKAPTDGVPVAQLSAEVQGWARLQLANRPLQQLKLAEARELVGTIARDLPNHPATTGLIPVGVGASHVFQSLSSLEKWEVEHTALTQNPPPDATERARFVTEAGTFEVAFFGSAAPQHVENFRALVRDGFYVRTRFHRVVGGPSAGIHIVQGGDPNSRDGQPEAWGQGSLGDGIPVERNRLVHIRGAVAMAQPGLGGTDPKSSGCQFYVVTAPSHSLDRRYTVFGQVVSGMEAIDKIAAGAVEPGTDRPKSPVTVTKTEIF